MMNFRVKKNMPGSFSTISWEALTVGPPVDQWITLVGLNKHAFRLHARCVWTGITQRYRILWSLVCLSLMQLRIPPVICSFLFVYTFNFLVSSFIFSPFNELLHLLHSFTFMAFLSRSLSLFFFPFII